MLTTKRLILRGPEPRDLDAMFMAYSDPQAMKFWSTPPHADRSITAEKMQYRVADWALHRRNFEIERDGTWIGNAGMFRDFEVGFMLTRSHWRKGIITEAMRTIIPHLFDTVGVPYMTADADPDNTASCGVLKSLGFRETHRAENTFLINGVWSHSVYFRLDPSDL